MKKVWVVGLLVISVLFAGTAFAGENIKIAVSVWLGYAPLYLAKEKGFFQKRGLDVDVVVINSVDLARSQQTYRIATPLNGRFKGQNVVAGNPDFEGEVSGSTFHGVMTDRTGYRAEFFGRKAAPGRFEGTGCDNRNRSYSFTLVKR
jgi:hypothetical protein